MVMTAELLRLETLLLEALKTVEQMKPGPPSPRPAPNFCEIIQDPKVALIKPQPEPSAPRKDAPEIKQGDVVMIDVPQFQLSRRPDGKLELGLFIMLSNQTVSRYPEVKYIAERERMWAMISGVAGGWELTKLPVVSPCKWWATFKYGKPTSKGGFYKDLLEVGLS